MKSFDMKKSVFYERYKPNCVEDLILPNSIKEKFKGYVETQAMPNLGFFSNLPGSGKSATANAILKDTGCEALWVNASMEKGIDILRSKIMKFASQSSFDDKIKIVVLDECLEENEEVRIGTVDDWTPVKLNELERGIIYNCVSFNMETGEFENDTCEIISDKIDEIFEVTLTNGDVVKVTGNHPFIVNQNGKFIEKSINDGLNENDDIVTVT